MSQRNIKKAKIAGRIRYKGISLKSPRQAGKESVKIGKTNVA